MVQTDVPQLSKECNQWRENLHSYRDEFNQLKNRLHKLASPTSSKQQMQDFDHYQNQFHIQLINIHDLKQEVKAHDKKIQFEVEENNGQIAEDIFAEHERLYEKYQSLEQTLNDLRTDFNRFVNGLQ